MSAVVSLLDSVRRKIGATIKLWGNPPDVKLAMALPGIRRDAITRQVEALRTELSSARSIRQLKAIAVKVLESTHPLEVPKLIKELGGPRATKKERFTMRLLVRSPTGQKTDLAEKASPDPWKKKYVAPSKWSKGRPGFSIRNSTRPGFSTRNPPPGVHRGALRSNFLTNMIRQNAERAYSLAMDELAAEEEKVGLRVTEGQRSQHLSKEFLDQVAQAGLRSGSRLSHITEEAIGKRMVAKDDELIALRIELENTHKSMREVGPRLDAIFSDRVERYKAGTLVALTPQQMTEDDQQIEAHLAEVRKYALSL